MSELRIKSVSFSGEMMIVRFSDGREIFVPMGYFPRLETANTAERERWSLIGRGLGVHWDTLDEDLSIENILTAYSRHQRAAYAHAAEA